MSRFHQLVAEKKNRKSAFYSQNLHQDTSNTTIGKYLFVIPQVTTDAVRIRCITNGYEFREESGKHLPTLSAVLFI